LGRRPDGGSAMSGVEVVGNVGSQSWNDGPSYVCGWEKRRGEERRAEQSRAE
jgi:hypothetical protein